MTIKRQSAKKATKHACRQLLFIHRNTDIHNDQSSQHVIDEQNISVNGQKARHRAQK